MRQTLLLAALLLCLVAGFAAAMHPTIAGLQPDGTDLLPTGQRISPAGVQVPYPGRPNDIALSPDGRTLAVLDIKSLVLVDVARGQVRQQIPVKPGHPFAGLVWSGDNEIIAPRLDGRLAIYSVSHGLATPLREVFLAAGGPQLSLQREGHQPVVPTPPLPSGSLLPASMVLRDGTLYVVLNQINALGRVQLSDLTPPHRPGGAPGVSPGMGPVDGGVQPSPAAQPRQLTADKVAVETCPVGIAPYGVALSADGTRLYVSNWAGRRPRPGDPTSASSGSQIVVNPDTGVACSGSVSVIDASTFKPKAEIPVGLHPTALVLHPTRPLLYVADANSDDVSIIDTQSDTVTGRIDVQQDLRAPYGACPDALAISPDGTRLYVAEAANNCVAVYDTAANTLLGLIPTAWYPGALQLSADARTLMVANVKGLGSLGPPALGPTQKGHNSHDHLGSISIIPQPQGASLPAVVRRNNHWGRPGRGDVPRFAHVVYIIKENRTYDQVLGDLGRGNGDPRLCVFGRNVTPNTHALAEQFVTLDNFYTCCVQSCDGHQWTDEAYATEYLEKFFGGFVRSYGDDPLCYAGSGFLWNNVMHHGLTVRNYGEGLYTKVTPPDLTWREAYAHLPFEIHNTAYIYGAQRFLSADYPGWKLKLPDQLRADVFIRDLEQAEQTGDWPNLMVMSLPDDHTGGTTPGLPTPRAEVADNDLALGRIVDAVSHSRFWPDTAIFVVEDDSQSGLDHVEAHRTVALCISPFTRRGAVDSTMYTQAGMVRTIEMALGVPPMTQFDALAQPMSGCFADSLDATPFDHLQNRIALDEMNPPLSSLSGRAREMAEQSQQQNFDVPDAADDVLLDRIIWASVRGNRTPYPNPGRAEDDD
ncbi:MAG: alkaline phosphatase family protein [Candidatus Xenobia bacterium]